MKRIILSALIGLMAISASAQLMRSEELEKYAKEKFGDKWVDAAANIGSQLALQLSDIYPGYRVWRTNQRKIVCYS